MSGYAVTRGRPLRRALVVLAAAAVAGSLGACGPSGAVAAGSGGAGATVSPTARHTTTTTTTAPAASSTSTPPATTTTTNAPTPSSTRAAAHKTHQRVPAGAAGTALAAVGLLEVKGRAPMTGYDREKFGSAWSDIDRNGCDQRNDVLRRDLVGITVKAGTHGCKVMSGTLHDPYTGMTVAFRHSSKSYSPVQIDHVVALGDAWAMGAWRWTEDQRKQLANDPLDLLAVDAHYNESKGAGDTATWLPPNKSERCAYVARQVAVKVKYHLAVTSAERAAMDRVLDTCPSHGLPTASVIPLGGGRVVSAGPTTKSPVPRAPRSTHPPAPAPSKPAAHRNIVHPGAYCAPVGARGWTTKGTLMKCSIKAGQDRARWRSAT